MKRSNPSYDYAPAPERIRNYSTIERVEPAPERNQEQTRSGSVPLVSCPITEDTTLLNGIPINRVLMLVCDFMRRVEPAPGSSGFGLYDAQRAIESDCQTVLKIAARELRLQQMEDCTRTE